MAKEAEKTEREPGIQRARPSYTVNPFEEMDRMFDRFIPRGWMEPLRAGIPFLGGGETRIPRVDVIDRDNDVIVRAEMPGVEKDDLEVSISNSSLTLKGVTHFEKREGDGEFFRHEIAHGAFTRTIDLPGLVDTEKTKAEFKHGILELTMPKVEKAKRRKIPIE